MLSKRRIREIARQGKQIVPQIGELAAMAEEHRKYVRQGKKPKKKKKRKPKPQLRATDYVTPGQFARIFNLTEAIPKKVITRKALNQALLIIMVESGLRISEVCNLRLMDLPGYHGKQQLQIIDGKGGKDRVVDISDDLADFLKFYVSRYKSGCGQENWLFRSEQGGRLSTGAARCKIKRLAVKAGVWTFTKVDGTIATKFTPHKLRHTMAMNLQESSGQITIVQEVLGHSRINTTNIYAKSLPEIRLAEINKSSRKFQERSGMDLQKLTTPQESEKCG